MKAAGRTRTLLGIGGRIQHLPAAVVFPLALLSGWGLPGGSRWAAGIFPGGVDALPLWHTFFGLLAGMVIAGHLLYLGVRAYVEGILWRDFPFRLSRRDLRLLGRDLVGPFAGIPSRGERYTPWRKGGWWVFVVVGSAAVLSGAFLRFWDLLDTPLISANLGGIAAAHAALASVLALALVAHVHAVLDAGRRPRLLLLAVTGRISEEDMEAICPAELARVREAETRRQEEIERSDLEKLAEREGIEQRRVLEGLLGEGNTLAREERWAEAAEAYRRALERFPFYSQAQFNLALVLERGGLAQEALAAYRRFLEIDPFHPLTERVREALRRLGGAE